MKTIVLAIAILISILSISASAAVDTLWARTYDETSTDVARRVGIDVAGNVYACGTPNWTVIKYYPDGDTAWLRQYSGEVNDMIVTPGGDIYMTGENSGYTTMKVNSEGETVWSFNFSSGYGEAICVDDVGNIYTTGTRYTDMTSGYDYFTVKYYDLGIGDFDTAWARTYTYVTADNDFARDIAVGQDGSVYVTGQSLRQGYDYDFATVAYDADGNESWVWRYSGSFLDEGVAVAVDGDGYACATGYTRVNPPMGAEDYITLRFDPSGDTVWTRTFNGTGNFQDMPTDVCIDQAGNIYVAGTSYGTFERDYLTIKYTQTGDMEWQRRYDFHTNSSDWTLAMFMDHNEDIWVTGRGNTSIDHKSDWMTLKYEASGNWDVISSFNGESDGRDYAYDIVVGTDNRFYVAGYLAQTSDDIPDLDFAVVAFQMSVAGDADGSGGVDIDDVVYLIAYIFGGGPEPVPEVCLGDADGSGGVDIDDVVYLIAYIFNGGPEPIDAC